MIALREHHEFAGGVVEGFCYVAGVCGVQFEDNE
jgi:hypothetical protein